MNIQRPAVLVPTAALVLISAAITSALAGAPAAPQTTPVATAAATSQAATTTAARGRGRGRGPTGPYAPETLPGKGLAEHNFMYAGEAAPLQIFLIKDGKIDWQCTLPKPARGAGEISDAKILPNGNILFAFQYGAAIVTPEKQIIWSLSAPAPAEIHTADAVGTDKIAVIENGLPPKLIVVNMADNQEVTSFTLPAGKAGVAADIHPQFRRLRVLDNGNFLVSHMDMGKVVEYDKTGKSVWSVDVASPWSAERLKNGNTLIASNSDFVREVDPKGETVWEFRPADAPGYRLFNTQTATRLPNGNTVINNWHTKDAGGEPVQLIEVTPDKKVVWALRSWTDPTNLGASTNFQLLDK